MVNCTVLNRERIHFHGTFYYGLILYIPQINAVQHSKLVRSIEIDTSVLKNSKSKQDAEDLFTIPVAEAIISLWNDR